MQCRRTPSPVPTLHIGCRPLENYTECTECPNAVLLGRIFRSARLFAAVSQSHKNSSNGKDSMAEERKKQYALLIIQAAVLRLGVADVDVRRKLCEGITAVRVIGILQ